MYTTTISSLIRNNQKEFITDCDKIYKIIVDRYKHLDSTALYHSYNVFALTSPKPLWLDLYKELKTFVLDFVGTEQNLWCQCWLNYHQNDQLGPHDHKYPYHGYISIEPHYSKTVFEDWTIHNKVGQIYIGPGHKTHFVDINDESELHTPRITLGFDIVTEDWAKGITDPETDEYTPIVKGMGGLYPLYIT